MISLWDEIGAPLSYRALYARMLKAAHEHVHGQEWTPEEIASAVDGNLRTVFTPDEVDEIHSYSQLLVMDDMLWEMDALDFYLEFTLLAPHGAYREFLKGWERDISRPESWREQEAMGGEFERFGLDNPWPAYDEEEDEWYYQDDEEE